MNEADRMNTPYYIDPEIRAKFDQVLHENAVMFANLGKDSTPDERKRAKQIEQKKIRRLYDLDPIKTTDLLLDD